MSTVEEDCECCEEDHEVIEEEDGQ